MIGLVLLCLTMLSLCGAALADDVHGTDASVTIAAGEKAGMYTITKSSGVEAGQRYLVMIQKGTDADGKPQKPTKENVYYMDWKSAEGASVSFSAYPKKMEDGEYVVYLSDFTSPYSGAAKKVGTLTVGTTSDSVLYYGDTDGDGVVTFGDIMRIIVAWNTDKISPELLASSDADGNGVVTFSDIMRIIVAWNTDKYLERG